MFVVFVYYSLFCKNLIFLNFFHSTRVCARCNYAHLEVKCDLKIHITRACCCTLTFESIDCLKNSFIWVCKACSLNLCLICSYCIIYSLHNLYENIEFILLYFTTFLLVYFVCINFLNGAFLFRLTKLYPSKERDEMVAA